MTDVTPNRNYTRIDSDGREPAVDIAFALNALATDIDTDMQTIVDAQDVTNEGIETDLDTIRADIDVVEADVVTVNTARINGDKVTEFSKTASAITRDGQDRITAATSGVVAISAVTFNGDGTRNTWTETIGATVRNYTAAYTDGLCTGVTFT